MAPDRTMPRLSVVITNYNYGRLVGRAIGSVLAQPGPPRLIVVDDCSTDDSRDVLEAYADRATIILQPQNRGHGGGFNAGFAEADGDLVMFLDADDFLLPGAVATILSNFEPDVAIYHYRLRYADEEDRLSGVFPPLETPLARGDLSEQLRRTGRYAGTVTSGLVFSRAVLERVMPMDEEAFRQGADGYLSAVVPLYGPSRAFDEPVAAYRLHGEQHSRFRRAYAKRARWRMAHDAERLRAIREHAARLGLPVARDLEARDLLNLEERLVSLVFEPELHPDPHERPADVIRRARALARRSPAGAAERVRSAWWSLAAVVPVPVLRTFLAWRVDPAARPVWLARAGRFVRTRLGVALK